MNYDIMHIHNHVYLNCNNDINMHNEVAGAEYMKKSKDMATANEWREQVNEMKQTICDDMPEGAAACKFRLYY